VHVDVCRNLEIGIYHMNVLLLSCSPQLPWGPLQKITLFLAVCRGEENQHIIWVVGDELLFIRESKWERASAPCHQQFHNLEILHSQLFAAANFHNKHDDPRFFFLVGVVTRSSARA